MRWQFFWSRDRMDKSLFTSNLFSSDATDKQIEESVGIRGHADSCIHLQWNDAFDLVVVAVQNIIFVGAHAVGHGFSAGKLAFGFDIDVHVFEGNYSWVDHNSHRQRVVHRGANVSALLGAVQIE